MTSIIKKEKVGREEFCYVIGINKRHLDEAGEEEKKKRKRKEKTIQGKRKNRT